MVKIFQRMLLLILSFSGLQHLEHHTTSALQNASGSITIRLRRRAIAGEGVAGSLRFGVGSFVRSRSSVRQSCEEATS